MLATLLPEPEFYHVPSHLASVSSALLVMSHTYSKITKSEVHLVYINMNTSLLGPFCVKQHSWYQEYKVSTTLFLYSKILDEKRTDT